jgi:hypothetical protein
MIRKLIAGQFPFAAAAGLAFWLAGCGYELETGYKYRPLNSTSVQRRGYYASPYSPEKSAAEQEQKNGPKHTD